MPDKTEKPSKPVEEVRQALLSQIDRAKTDAAALVPVVERGDAFWVRPLAIRHLEAWSSLAESLAVVDLH
ncbi:MAG: hypothetical protein M3P52_11915 [Actinomycetota bacterium]|nr:hypothetical protein [Actinomycetota bacterium]